MKEKKVIKKISKYCKKHMCINCKYHNDEHGCPFQVAPCNWVFTLKGGVKNYEYKKHT